MRDLGAEIIDINMGCPAKKLLKKTLVPLMGDPKIAKQIVEAVVDSVDCPVTVKCGLEFLNKK